MKRKEVIFQFFHFNFSRMDEETYGILITRVIIWHKHTMRIISFSHQVSMVWHSSIAWSTMLLQNLLLLISNSPLSQHSKASGWAKMILYLPAARSSRTSASIACKSYKYIGHGDKTYQTINITHMQGCT